MFTKAFIPVLLGVTFAFTSTPTDNTDVEDQLIVYEKNWGQTFKEWLYRTENTLEEYSLKCKKSFYDILGQVTEISEKSVIIGIKERLARLKENYDEIKKKAKKDIVNKKKEWIPYLKKLKNKGYVALENFKEEMKEFMEQRKKLQVKQSELNEKRDREYVIENEEKEGD